MPVKQNKKIVPISPSSNLVHGLEPWHISAWLMGTSVKITVVTMPCRGKVIAALHHHYHPRPHPSARTFTIARDCGTHIKIATYVVLGLCEWVCAITRSWYFSAHLKFEHTSQSRISLYPHYTWTLSASHACSRTDLNYETIDKKAKEIGSIFTHTDTDYCHHHKRSWFTRCGRASFLLLLHILFVVLFATTPVDEDGEVENEIANLKL